MSLVVKTKPNDTLDAVAWRTLGNTQALASIIELNPHINNVDPILPANTVVVLPQAQAAGSRVKKLINLWD